MGRETKEKLGPCSEAAHPPALTWRPHPSTTAEPRGMQNSNAHSAHTPQPLLRSVCVTVCVCVCKSMSMCVAVGVWGCLWVTV